VAVGACGGADGTTEPVASNLVVDAGANQRAEVGASLPIPITLRVINVLGAPIADAVVRFEEATGGGDVTPRMARAGPDGRVTFSWRLGAQVGTQRAAFATGVGDPRWIEATAEPEVRMVNLVGGNNQSGVAGSSLAQPVVAEVRRARDFSAVTGAVVEFESVAGGGTPTPVAGTTDGSGRVSTNWRLGTVAGTQELRVRARGGASALDAEALARATATIGLQLSAGTLAFTATQGGALPTAQLVSVTAASGAASGLVPTVSYTSGTGWLAATVGSNTPATLTVRPSRTDLAAGTYSATVTIAAPGTTQVQVAVSYVVTARIDASPASLAFTGVANGAVPAAQTVSISTPSGAATLQQPEVSYGTGGNWLGSPTLSSQTTPATLTVRPTTTFLATGTYTAQVTVRSTNGGSVVVPVTLTIGQGTPSITAFAVSPPAIVLAQGLSAQLTYSVQQPQGAPVAAVSLTSSNAGVASVMSATRTVTAVSTGSAQVTARASVVGSGSFTSDEQSRTVPVLVRGTGCTTTAVPLEFLAVGLLQSNSCPVRSLSAGRADWYALSTTGQVAFEFRSENDASVGVALIPQGEGGWILFNPGSRVTGRYIAPAGSYVLEIFASSVASENYSVRSLQVAEDAGRCFSVVLYGPVATQQVLSPTTDCQDDQGRLYDAFDLFSPNRACIIEMIRSGPNPMADPYLTLLRADYRSVFAQDDNAGGDLNSRITLSRCTDPDGRIVRVRAGRYASSAPGSYLLRVSFIAASRVQEVSTAGPVLCSEALRPPARRSNDASTAISTAWGANCHRH
jgi:hypothetical protein